MFGFFKKKKNDSVIFSPCAGSFLRIENVNDPVFSGKMMGDGYAVSPSAGVAKVYSPIKGKVLSIFPTQHAITFLSDDGLEVLVHMGIDTVALNGEGFDLKVSPNDKVDENTLLAEMNIDFITEQGKGTDIIVVITNLEDNKKINIDVSGAVTPAQPVGTVQFL